MPTGKECPPFVARLALRPTCERLDFEESELAEAGLVRLPEESLPDSFWKTPAPRVSFVDAVWRHLGAGRRLKLIRLVPLMNPRQIVRRSRILPLFNCEDFRLYSHSYEARMRPATRSKVLTAF